MGTDIKLLDEHMSFGGWVRRYEHVSDACKAPMRFSIYLPTRSAGTQIPAVYFLAGLTCTEETFMMKSGAQRYASKLGLMLVAPDTSPRNTGIEGETQDWDLGSGASFYVDATAEPWRAHYQMRRYVTEELPAIIAEHFPVDRDRTSLCGHSMGGHGALTCALREPKRYRSVSAFAPVCAPSQTPWGQKAFHAYLGDDKEAWLEYDTQALLQRTHKAAPLPILIDQGRRDPYLEKELKTQWLEDIGRDQLTLRWHPHYDHSYFFIASFIEDHLAFHAQHLYAVP